MSSFLTNPESPPPIERHPVIHWEHKEATINALQQLGVPFRPAELAMIDFKHVLGICQRNKLSASQTATMMLSIVERAYKNDDDSWQFAS